MTATVSYVSQKVREFNELIFDSSLPPVRIKLVKARTFLGKMQYSYRRGFLGLRTGNRDFVLKISSLFDLPQDELDDVIIHEMIHYHIAVNNIKDTSAHGQVFRHYMDEINSRFGRHVSIRHKGAVPAGEPSARTSAPRIICVSLLEGGLWGVTVCAQSRVGELRRRLPRFFRVERMDWYLSSDEFFRRFPRSRTPKIYKVSREDLDKHLAGAEKLA